MNLETVRSRLATSFTRSRFYPWLIVAILFFVAAFNYGHGTAITTLFPLLREDLGMTDVELAAVSTLFLWSYGIASPLAGYAGDRLSRSAVITRSLALWSLITIATSQAATSSQLLGMRVVLGLPQALYIPAAIAFIADYHSLRTRALAISLHLTGFYFGVVASGTLTGYLGDHYGWRFSTLTLGIAGLLMALLCHFLLFDRKDSERLDGDVVARPEQPLPLGKTVTRITRVPSFWILTVAGMMMSVVAWIFNTWLPLFFRERFGMSLAGAGFTGTVATQVGGGMGGLVGGYISDLVARRQLRHRMLVQAVCSFVAAPFLLAFLGSSGLSVILFCIFSYAFVRAIGGANEAPVICDILPRRQRAPAFGIMNMLNCLTGGAGVLVAGYLKRDFGLPGIFTGAASLVFLAGFLFVVGYVFFIRRDLKRYQPGFSAE